MVCPGNPVQELTSRGLGYVYDGRRPEFPAEPVVCSLTTTKSCGRAVTPLRRRSTAHGRASVGWQIGERANSRPSLQNCQIRFGTLGMGTAQGC